MSNKLTRLPKTQFSGLDYDNIIEDITRLVVDNPEYNENWDYFLSSNAGRMITELFAYIADQLATRIDWNINENYLGTASQKASVIKILKLIGYDFRLPVASAVPVNLSFSRPIGNGINFGPAYDLGSGIISPYTITAKDKNGKTKNFELLYYDEVNTEYDYRTDILFDTGTASSPSLTHSTTFYEGTTLIESPVATTDNNPIFTLSQNPVIENSVKVFFVDGLDDSVELLRVNTFLDPEAQQTDQGYAIPYVLTVQEDDTVTVEFGSTALLPNSSRRLTIGDQVRIFYRIGGGVDGNLTVQSINTTKQLSFNGNIVDVTFINTAQGAGGTNAETSDEAIAYAPLQVRTANKTVTAEDYDITLNANTTIVKAKSYGNANFPGNLVTLYGEYIKPLDVWNFILKEKSGWEDINPSRYKDFEWISLRLENRFNEIMAFRDGGVNELVLAANTNFNTTDDSIDWDGNGVEDFKNYVILRTSDSFHSALKISGVVNTDFKAKITPLLFLNNFFDLITTDNIFIPKYTNNSALLEGSTPVYQIKEDMSAWFLSRQDLTTPLDIDGTNDTLIIGLDNRTNLTITLDTDSSSTITEIVENITDAFIAGANYNNAGNDTTQGSQEFGLNVTFSNDAGLTDDTVFYFRVNGIEYNFTSGTNTTYNQLLVLINAALSLTITGNLISGEDEITSITGGNVLQKVKTGWRITGTGILADTFVGPINIFSNQISMVDGSDLAVNATASGTDVTVTLYPFYATENSSDLLITNTQKLPYGPVFIEDGTQPLNENNLLSTFWTDFSGGSGLQASTDSEGPAGYHEFGINGALDDTLGFQTFQEVADPTGLATTTQYYFKVAADGGSIIEYDITTGGTVTASDIAALIDTAVTAVADCAVVTDNLGVAKIRITSSGTPGAGTPSTISITAGTSSPDMLAAFTIPGVDTAVAGVTVDSGLVYNTVGPIAGDYYFKINGRNHYITTAAAVTSYGDIFDLLVTYFADEETPYTASEQDPSTDEWLKDIRITHNTTAPVLLEKNVIPSGYQQFNLTGAPSPATDDYEFKLTVDGNAADSGSDLIVALLTTDNTLALVAAKIHAVVSTYDATCAVVDDGSGDKIRITSDATGQGSAILIEEPASGNSMITLLTSLENHVGDLFQSFGIIDTLNGIAYNPVAWSALDTPIGGGDYQNVATVVVDTTVTPTREYIMLKSPCFGEFTSEINIAYVASNDATLDVFNLSLSTGDEVKSYGYQKATIVTNELLVDEYGDIIFDYGSYQLFSSPMSFYLHFLSSDISTIDIGDYRNTEFATTDPSWRIPATRVYSTAYNSNNEIDRELSEFKVRFTDALTESMSVYAITDTWGLTEAVEAQVSSSGSFDVSTDLSITINRIKVDIDNRGAVEIDVTTDDYATPPYTLSDLITNINDAIQADANYLDGDLYENYNYATLDATGTTFTIRSPLNNNNSEVELQTPSTDDATNAIFGVSTGTYLVSGDYYINYDLETLSGTFTDTSNIITLISDIDIAKASVGMRILDVSTTMSRGYITAVDNSGAPNNTITVSFNAIATTATEFKISDDKMVLGKISTSSNLPDYPFYFHYIFDKRLVETAFDGETIGSYLHPGFIDGSLDEDIFVEAIENKKIVGINNVFKETRMNTFDITGTVYHSKLFSAAEIEVDVVLALETAFGLDNRDFAETVPRSKVMSVIHAVDGVDYVEFTYFGKNATDSSTNEANTITAEFDEVIVLSEEVTVVGLQTHGIKFTYTITT